MIVASVMAFAWSHSAFSTGKDKDPDVEQEQDQDQQQEQEANAEAQAEAHASSEASSNEQSTNISSSYQRPSSVYLGSGNSSASDQKVFSLGGGWLTGGAAIRFDLTDKEARKWRWADEIEVDGYPLAAVEMRCTIKTLYKALGGKDDCVTKLSGNRIADGTKDNAQDVQIEEMMRQLEYMRDELERKEEQCDRQWESCIRK